MQRREASLDQQLDFAVIGEAREHSSDTDRIGARDEETAGGDERALQIHLDAQHARLVIQAGLIDRAIARIQPGVAQRRRHRPQRRRRERLWQDPGA